jgi:hypothetical protein
MKIVFFGDSYLSLNSFLMIFNEEDRIVVCDASECGMYVTSKFSTKYEGQLKILSELIKELDGDIPVEAYNNGIAHFFFENEIHSIRDLKNTLNI